MNLGKVLNVTNARDGHLPLAHLKEDYLKPFPQNSLPQGRHCSPAGLRWSDQLAPSMDSSLKTYSAPFWRVMTKHSLKW